VGLDLSRFPLHEMGLAALAVRVLESVAGPLPQQALPRIRRIERANV
jgi:hypothetical protein